MELSEEESFEIEKKSRCKDPTVTKRISGNRTDGRAV